MTSQIATSASADRACGAEDVDDPFAGLRVALVAPAAPPVGGMTVQAEALRARLLAEGAHVVSLPTNPRVPGVLGRLPKVRGAMRLAAFRRELERVLAAGVDVVHVHTASWAYFHRVTAPTVRAALTASVRTVVRWEGGDADAFLARHGDAVREVLARADEVVVPSAWAGRVLTRRLRIAPRVIPNLVEVDDSVRPTARSEGRLRLLCARHLEPTYGVDVVIRAVALAAAGGASPDLVVAGAGSERRALERLARDLLPGGVRFLGEVPRGQVLAMLRESDVVVNASRIDNFPVALAEAQAAGVPVVTTSAGGIPGVVADGETGLVSPVDDAESLAASILRLDRDRGLLAAYGRMARLRAKRWTWEALRRDWAYAYGRRTSRP